MIIKTTLLKELVNKLTSIIKIDTLKPITEIAMIKASEGKLTMGMTNHIREIAIITQCTGELDTCAIDVTKLKKLIALVTDEELEILKDGDVVSVKTAKGIFKQGIKYDDNGRRLFIKFSFKNFEPKYKMNLDCFSNIYKRCKLSLYTDDANPELRQYCYSDGKLLATDGLTIAATYATIDLGINIPTFIIEDLAAIGGDVNFEILEGVLYIYTDNLYYRAPMYNSEPFPLHLIANYLSYDKSLSYKVESKTDFKNIIKRQNIFKIAVSGIQAVRFYTDSGMLMVGTNNSAESLTESNEDIDLKIPSEPLLKFINVLQTPFTLYFGKETLVLEDELGFFLLGVVDD